MKFDTTASKNFQFLSQLHSGTSASLVHLELTTRESTLVFQLTWNHTVVLPPRVGKGLLCC